MQTSLMQLHLSSPPQVSRCCDLSSVRQHAALGRLRQVSYAHKSQLSLTRSPTQCAAATLEAPTADEEAPALSPTPSAPAADDEDEYITTGPALRVDKKRSRRFKEMEKKVPAKTTVLGAHTLVGTSVGSSRSRLHQGVVVAGAIMHAARMSSISLHRTVDGMQVADDGSGLDGA